MLCLCYFDILQTVLGRIPVQVRLWLNMSVKNLNLSAALDEDPEDS